MRVTSLVAAFLSVVLICFFGAPTLVLAAGPSPVWLQPSPNWLGIDGNWSSFDFLIGGQSVSLLVSTGLSETWVVDTGGCADSPLCTAARGGVYSPSLSHSWTSLGAWELGLSYLGYGHNGDYGLETMSWNGAVARHTTTIKRVLVAAINSTDYYQGLIGVGNTDANFGDKHVMSLMNQMAGTYATIPSHSYAYTAGASYAGDGQGVPSSLVLGGYDELRFTPHDISFKFDPNHQAVPTVLLRGISVSVTSQGQKPAHWNSTTQTLLGYNATSNFAVIESSSPYLWLPTAVCEVFAEALNLTWAEDYGVYIFSDVSQYTQYLRDSSFQFTFSLSSFDNTDNYTEPLEIPGVVNITITSAAFAQLLRYPFQSQIQFGNPSVPYFPLKRSDNGTMVIGRVFLQEVYMIMKYDVQTFAIYQARFPDNAASNYSLMSLDKTGASSSLASPSSVNLTTAAVVGIAVGTVVTVGIVAVLSWFCCCRKRKNKNKNKKTAAVLGRLSTAVKEDESVNETEEPTSPIGRIMSTLRARPRRIRGREAHEVSGDNAQPAEVPNHELYEMHVQQEPAEMDGQQLFLGDETIAIGTDGSREMNAYALARRKLVLQLQETSPASYAPPQVSIERELSQVTQYRPPDDASPISTPSYGNHSSLPSASSPTTPRSSDWPNRHMDLPSPLTIVPPMSIPFVRSHCNPYETFNPYSPDAYYAPPELSPPIPNTNQHPDLPQTHALQSPHSSLSSHLDQLPLSPFSPWSHDANSMSRSTSLQHTPVSPIGSPLPPSPTYQRTPIDSSNIICLGPLPEYVQLPPLQQPPTPGVVFFDDATIASSAIPVGSSTQPPVDQDSLGSNFTVEEEAEIQQQVARTESMRAQERIDDEFDIVHVPQVADRRFSWEYDCSQNT